MRCVLIIKFFYIEQLFEVLKRKGWCFYNGFILMFSGVVRWQAANMGENIAKLIDSHFSESIDMSEEQVYDLLIGILKIWIAAMLGFSFIHEDTFCRMSFLE